MHPVLDYFLQFFMIALGVAAGGFITIIANKAMVKAQTQYQLKADTITRIIVVLNDVYHNLVDASEKDNMLDIFIRDHKEFNMYTQAEYPFLDNELFKEVNRNYADYLLFLKGNNDKEDSGRKTTQAIHKLRSHLYKELYK